MLQGTPVLDNTSQVLAVDEAHAAARGAVAFFIAPTDHLALLACVHALAARADAREDPSDPAPG